MKSTELTPGNNEPLITSEEAAKMLGMKPRYFSEKFIFQHPDFPKAVRFGPKAPRRYYASQIAAFRDKFVEA